MKLYRNCVNLKDGIMSAEDVLDKYLDYVHGMSCIIEITAWEAAIAIIDEQLPMTAKVKAYLTVYAEKCREETYAYIPKDWQIAVDIIAFGNNNKADNKDK